jgi:hypothetical protein
MAVAAPGRRKHNQPPIEAGPSVWCGSVGRRASRQTLLAGACNREPTSPSQPGEGANNSDADWPRWQSELGPDGPSVEGALAGSLPYSWRLIDRDRPRSIKIARPGDVSLQPVKRAGRRRRRRKLARQVERNRRRARARVSL